MMATAVVPIAIPIRTRLRKGSGSACRTGESGCSSNATNKQAEIMKRPSSAPSIRYSGQCRLHKAFMVFRRLDADGSPRFPGNWAGWIRPNGVTRYERASSLSNRSRRELTSASRVRIRRSSSPNESRIIALTSPISSLTLLNSAVTSSRKPSRPSATVRMSDRRLSAMTLKCRLISSVVSRSIEVSCRRSLTLGFDSEHRVESSVGIRLLRAVGGVFDPALAIHQKLVPVSAGRRSIQRDAPDTARHLFEGGPPGVPAVELAGELDAPRDVVVVGEDDPSVLDPGTGKKSPDRAVGFAPGRLDGAARA